MKKILVLTSPEGHLSIAKAFKKMLEADFNVKVSNLMEKQNGFKFYTPFYRYFPSLFQFPYKLGKKDTVQKTFKTIFKTFMEKEVKKEVKSFCPDLIVSTNLFYDPSLTKILDYQTKPIPYLNFIPNPWNIHPLEVSSQAVNLFYDKKGINFGKKLGLKEKQLKSLGWPVRSQFYKGYDAGRIKKKLNFKKNVFTILICGGSEGTNMILKIIPSLLMIKKKVQVVAVCGSNQTLFKALNSFKKLLPKLAKTKIDHFSQIKKKLNLKIFGFVDNMAELIQASDLVVGKAGPNLIFETAALKKPFFAICHISGQEDDNLVIIRKKGLGFVEENAFKAIKLLKQIINRPEMLNKFTKTIEKERQNNLKVKGRFLNLVKTSLKVQ